ncbi:MAG: ABC transporter substrate-binding protein [Pseudorhodobacter sp.]
MRLFNPKGMLLGMLMGSVAFAGLARADADTRLTYVMVDSINVLGDPVMGVNFSEHQLSKAMFEPLIFDFDARSGESGLRPMLATSWEVVDPLRWRFKLREGVTFHNGNPFNAKAVQFSIMRVMDPEFKTSDKFKAIPITAVEIIDDYTVDIVTSEPVPILPANLTRNGAFILDPEHYANLSADEARFSPMGTGPYKLVEHRADDRVVMARHDGYWGWTPESNITEVVVRFIPELSTAVSELLEGSVDIVRITPDLADTVEAANGVSVIVAQSTNKAMMAFNQQKHPEMADPRVRLALNHAIDRKGLVDALAFGQHDLISLTTVNPPFENPALKPYEYDVDLAKQLLADAGYPNGFEIDAIDVMVPDAFTWSEVVAEYWRQVGVNVGEVRLLDWTVVRERWANRTLGVHSFSWAAPENTPLTDLYSISDRRPTNSTHWLHPEFEELYTQLMTEMDEDERQRLNYRMQEIAYNDPPWAPLFRQPQVIGVRDRVGGYQPHPAFSQADWTSIYIKSE